MKIQQKHLCPACRVERPDWTVRGAEKVKHDYGVRTELVLAALPQDAAGVLRRAVNREPGRIEQALQGERRHFARLDLMDRCGACGQGIVGTLDVEIDEDRGMVSLGSVEDSMTTIPRFRAEPASQADAEAIP